MMKLLFAIKALDNPGGGAERVFAGVASGLAARGHRVQALSYDPPGGRSFYELDPKVKRIRIPIGSAQKPARPVETLRRMVALRRVVRETRPDAAVAFLHSMYLPLGFAMTASGVPMLASEHIVPAHFRRRPLERALMRLTPRVADRIAVVSGQALEAFDPNLRRAMVVIPNPVHVHATGRADVAGRAKERKILLTVGRLTEQKDHATLVSAFALIADHAPDWDLRIVGDGELRRPLEEQVASLGLTGRIVLSGSARDIGAEYRAAQLFVLPSRYESLGLVTLEAMAHGLPVVGFADCPGTNVLVKPGENGLLVENADRVADLARALGSLMCDPQRRLALAPEAGTVDVGECGIEAVLDRWEQVIGEVVAARRRAAT